MRTKWQWLFQRRDQQLKQWQLGALLAALTLLIIGSSALASAQAQPQQSYWLGRLVGTEYVFDTPLPTDFAAMITASGSKYAVGKNLPKPSTRVIDGERYSFVTTEVSWDKDAIDRGSIAYVINGTLGAAWFTMDAKSAEWPAIAQAAKAQATVASADGAWKRATLLVLIAPDAEKPTLRLSQYGYQQRYWLGRMVGTEYVFDTPLPVDFAEAVLAADPKLYTMDKAPRAFPPQTSNGTAYSFVKARITYDKPQFDKGQIALDRKVSTANMLWIDTLMNSAVGKPLAQQLPVPKQGEWKSVDLLILIAPDAVTPAVRVPIPEMTLANAKMNELGQQTKAGEYYPAVKVPADLDAFRAQMLAYGNAGRRDPNFRQDNGAKTATDLSGDTVDAYADETKTTTHKEKVFKQSQTPPYFADHVLNDALNQAAQFQAEYQASIRQTGHDGPRAFRDPKSGKSVNLFDLSQRAAFFGAPANVVEAAACCSLGDAPHGWMAGDTHFRPWFNVDGCYPAIGYGAALGTDGKWYFAAVPIRDADCLTPPAQPTTAPTAQPTAAAPAATAAATQAAPAQPTSAPAQADRFPLHAGRTIVQGQKYPSASGDHYLIFQPDGNVVVYTAADQYVWGLQSVTDNYGQTQSVQMQDDGNFVIRGANDEYIWSALTENPDPSAYLQLTPEGVLQLVSGDSATVLWASDGDLTAVPPTLAPTATAAVAAQATTAPTATAEITTTVATTLTPTAPPAATAAATARSDAPGSNTPIPATVTDVDGNVYGTVQVGDQLWLTENLRTASCSDGTALPLVSDKDEWVTQAGAAYTWSSDVIDDPQAQAAYGALYNAHAALLPCNICPSGWRVPSQADFQVLLASQGDDAHLKLSDPAFWGAASSATNASGWRARPAGGDGGDTPGSYDFGTYAYFWSTTQRDEGGNYLLAIHAGDAGANAVAALRYGFSVRCVQDLPRAEATAVAPPAAPPVTAPAPPTAGSTTEPTTQILGTQSSSATCNNIPAPANGAVRARFVNTGLGSQDIYMYYTGSVQTPAPAALQFIVKQNQRVDVEAAAGTQWEMRTHFGEIVGAYTASAQQPCAVLKKFRIRQSVADNPFWAPNARSACNNIPAPQADTVTLRFFNARNPSRYPDTVAVYKTDLTGSAPAAVEQFTLAPGKTYDFAAEAGSLWEIRDASGASLWALQASAQSTQCVTLSPNAFSTSSYP